MKGRKSIYIDKEVLKRAEKEAKHYDRSFNNWLERHLATYFGIYETNNEDFIGYKKK